VVLLSCGLRSIVRQRRRFGPSRGTARRAGIATFAAVLLAAIVLVMAAFNNDFSIAYIRQHSNRDLSVAYKFAVLLSGQEARCFSGPCY